MQGYTRLLEETFDNLQEIGSGGGGTVFKAYHKRLEKEVILKKIHTNLVNAVDRKGELNILKGLKHPYIPQIYDFFDSGDEVYTVMEYIEGKSFADYLAEGRRFPQKDVVRWAGQLCEVVNYLHSRKPPIIHCDIKPANIMLMPDGNICLIDFNISGTKSEEGLATIGYSDGYAPVEQFAVVSDQAVKRYEKRKAASGGAGSGLYAGMGADATEIDIDATEMDFDTAETAADATEIDMDVPETAADATEIDTDATEMDFDTTETAADATEIDTDATEIDMDVPEIAADATEIDIDVTEIDTDTTETAADATEIDTDATEMDFDTAETAADVTEIDTDVTEIDTDVTEIDAGFGKAGNHARSGAAKAMSAAPAIGRSAKSAGSTGSPASAGTKSLMKALTDEDWQKARRMAASLGSNPAIDERTDIYSVGASLYAILTGVKPMPFYRPYLPVEDAGKNVSESFAYVINKAMATKPENRFKDSGEMLKTVRNMGKYDRRYKALVRRQTLVAVAMAVLTAASALCISGGRRQIAKERQEAYSAYVKEMQQERAEKNYGALEEIYEEAIQVMPEGQDAYYEMGMAYFEQKDYEGCISYLNDSVLANPQIQENASYGRFYYINGSCYFELEDYASAVLNYEKAVALQPDEVSYYRDYVVSLAREGKAGEAEEVLQTAAAKNVSADVLSLLEGEIALAKGDYAEAERGFSDCIEITGDSYHLLRAYTKLDDVYQEKYDGAEEYEKRIALLSEAMDALPEKDRITLTERLAQVYIDYALLSEENGDTEMMRQYDDMAIGLFRENEEKGYATFAGRYNIALLYEKNGDYDAAKEQIQSMLDEYPDNYTLYKTLCFIALETENLKQNAERNYGEFQTLYDTAMELYQENASGQDSEMLLLKQLYQDLVANGWLS